MAVDPVGRKAKERVCRRHFVLLDSIQKHATANYRAGLELSPLNRPSERPSARYLVGRLRIVRSSLVEGIESGSENSRAHEIVRGVVTQENLNRIPR
jgi:hypothetical protein